MRKRNCSRSPPISIWFGYNYAQLNARDLGCQGEGALTCRDVQAICTSGERIFDFCLVVFTEFKSFYR